MTSISTLNDINMYNRHQGKKEKIVNQTQRLLSRKLKHLNVMRKLNEQPSNQGKKLHIRDLEKSLFQ